MLYKTLGIVLNKSKYGDNGLIARIYTKTFGLQSYLVQGARHKNSAVKASMIQPLALLDLVVYHKEARGLQRIKEFKPNHPFVSIPYDFKKNSIALFLAEILGKTICEEYPDIELFDYIYNAIRTLDLSQDSQPDFHLLFILLLTKHLGFQPHGEYTPGESWFDLKEGCYQSTKPEHEYAMNPELSSNLWKLSQTDFEELSSLKLTANTRRALLKGLIDYCTIHITSMKEIRSHLVLEEVAR